MDIHQEPLDRTPAEAKDANKPLIIIAAILCGIYLLNPTAGFFELIPDNIPVIGNLDEGMAAYVVISAMAYLKGVDFGLFGKKNGSKP
jgi:uncharacterized membrane protein YkvA (DUF1232 family)